MLFKNVKYRVRMIFSFSLYTVSLWVVLVIYFGWDTLNGVSEVQYKEIMIIGDE